MVSWQAELKVKILEVRVDYGDIYDAHFIGSNRIIVEAGRKNTIER